VGTDIKDIFPNIPLLEGKFIRHALLQSTSM